MLKTELWSSNSTSGFLSAEVKALTWKYTCTPMFFAALDMEATEVSINEWMDKENVIYTHNRILIIHKREILSFVTPWMDLEDYHAKWNKLDRER